MRFSAIVFCTLLIPVLSMAQLEGSWISESAEGKTAIIYSWKYFAATRYDLSGKKFISTWGGSWTYEKGVLTETHEFNTADPSLVGTKVAHRAKVGKKSMTLTVGDKKQEFVRMDDGTPGQLAGAWLITGRMNDGKVSSIIPGARRTMKILSGTRFQWIAYNTETKEFFGTGGGTYTTVDGAYTETLEFFSRDNSRVGSSLNFQFRIEEGRWRHSGLSSKGEPIDEYWATREALGI
ncbi:MAG: membrane or secreted protein [Bacteroidota bacterium]